MPGRTYAKGDSVIHAGKPEWGPGDVMSAQGQLHEGRPCQRLTIRFARGGLKTISTAFADLRPASEAPLAMLAKRAWAPPDDGGSTEAKAHNGAEHLGRGTGESEPTMQDVLDRAASLEALQKLPESINDPFVPIMKRVLATLTLYKLWDKPAGVLDWATGQTGLRDPMSLMSRHELEAQMDRFRIGLDGHLKKILKDARREDPKGVEAALAQCGPAAKAALRRVDIGR
jgi:hypothetical protein